MHALTMRVSSAPAAVLRELVSTALPTGNNRPTSTAMIVITTNNSIRVKPRSRLLMLRGKNIKEIIHICARLSTGVQLNG